MIGRNDECWCGSGMKWKKCHFPQLPPPIQQELPFDKRAEIYLKTWGILLKTPSQIEGIRRASLMSAEVLDIVSDHAQAGVTTDELDKLAYDEILKRGAIPASLHYGNPPFPKSICTSLNEVICHGIPDTTPLRDGDIVNIDLAVIYEGFYGDCSKMVAIGKVSRERKRVFDTAYACLMESIEAVRPGAPLNAVGAVIDKVAHRNGCSVVTDFVGHGVGLQYHEAPHVYHYYTGCEIPFTAGMTFTIEPMINAGTHMLYIDSQDHWTARTRDGRASAQWEHTLLVTESGVEILTPWKKTEAIAL